MNVLETYKKQFIIEQLYAKGVNRVEGSRLEDLDYDALKRELAKARNREE